MKQDFILLNRSFLLSGNIFSINTNLKWKIEKVLSKFTTKIGKTLLFIP